MSTTQTRVPALLLTIDDLRERWGVSEDTIREHIRHDGLPFIPFGRGGKRPVYRFRLVAIEAWEAERERRIRTPASVTPEVPPPVVAASWDGKVRIGSRRKKAAGR